jgi:hypothetical protein
MVKDPDDYNGLVQYIRKNFNLLKNQYIYISATGQFPFIEMNAFTNYTRRANFINPNIG